MMRGRFGIIITAAFTCGVIAPALAQFTPQPAQPGTPQQQPGVIAGAPGADASRLTVKQMHNKLTDILTAVGKHFNVLILADPAIPLLNEPQLPPAESTVDAAMNDVVKSIPDTAWKKVYVKSSPDGQLPDAAKIAAALRALDVLDSGNMIVEDTQNQKISTLKKDNAPISDLNAEITTQKLDKTPVIVLYFSSNNITDMALGQPAANKLGDIQRQQMQLMLQMDPNQIANATKNSMSMMMNLDPNTRVQMMVGTATGFIQMMQSLPQDQRRQFFSDMRQTFTQMRGQMQGQGPGFMPGGPSPAAPQR